MTAVTQPTQRKPGKVGFWIGGVLIVLALVAGIGGVALGVTRVTDAIDGYQRASLRDGGTLQLEAGAYNVFLESPGIDDDPLSSFGTSDVQIVNSEGRAVPIGSAGSVSLTYSYGGHDGRRIGKVTIDQAGTYRVQASPTGFGSQSVAVGKGDPTGGLVLVGLGIAAGFVLGIAGVIVLIVSGVRRSRANRTPTGYPGAPGPGWGAPPGGGWGAPAGPAWPPAPGPGGWAPAPTPPPGTAPGWAPPGPSAPPTAPGGWSPGTGGGPTS